MTLGFVRALVAAVSLFVAASSAIAPSAAGAGERFITVASTTSTANSGLFDKILPVFEDKTGIEVRVVAVGTGQALRLARNGDADVLFVHHEPSEIAFVEEGFGVERFDVMYNDFVLVGPKSDPAGVRALQDIGDALAGIARSESPFVSRGDDSGTHKRELSLWKAAELDPAPLSGAWYQELGAGMGATLNTAAAKNAYALTDRGTWLSFENKAELTVLAEGDDRLLNPYGVILVSAEKFAHVKTADGQAFIDWLISGAGQKAIAAFKIDGEQLFFPSALPSQPSS